MTLQEVFEQAKKDGYTKASNNYSWHGRKMDKWAQEIVRDGNDYRYDSELGVAEQDNPYPSCTWSFW